MTVSEIGPDGEEEQTGPKGQDNDVADETENRAAGEPVELSEEATRLDLEDDDPPLPWLQGDDDDDDFEDTGIGQTLGFVVLGLLAIGLVVGGIWFVTKRDQDDVLVADGSTIAAPKTAYKTRPDDPGGKVFEGTGDTSFGISEGQKRPARLGDGDATQRDVTHVPKSADEGATAAGGAPIPPSDSAGVGVQVAAYSDAARAEEGWTRLTGQHPALSGLKHRVVQGQADIGTVYRLQADAADAAAARALCAQLKASGLNCQVKN